MTRFACTLGLCLLLVSGGWPAGRAAPRQQSMIAVVLAKAAPVRTLRLGDLALIYRRKQLLWKDGTKVNPVNLPANNPLRRMFSQAVLGATPEDLDRYWNDMYFHGVSPPFVLSSDEAVLRFVAQTRGAIGYVSYCSVAGRAHVVLILSASGAMTEEAARASCE
jgi:hypothetical protein